jgi:hypothetical protein
MLSYFIFVRSHISKDKKETFLKFILHGSEMYLSNSIPDEDGKVLGELMEHVFRRVLSFDRTYEQGNNILGSV